MLKFVAGESYDAILNKFFDKESDGGDGQESIMNHTQSNHWAFAS